VRNIILVHTVLHTDTVTTLHIHWTQIVPVRTPTPPRGSFPSNVPHHPLLPLTICIHANNTHGARTVVLLSFLLPSFTPLPQIARLTRSRKHIPAHAQPHTRTRTRAHTHSLTHTYACAHIHTGCSASTSPPAPSSAHHTQSSVAENPEWCGVRGIDVLGLGRGGAWPHQRQGWSYRTSL
jgi:hypothetical protein